MALTQLVPQSAPVKRPEIPDQALERRGGHALREKDLLATWRVIASLEDRNGMERYLADRLDPLIGSYFPDMAPICVDLLGK